MATFLPLRRGGLNLKVVPPCAVRSQSVKIPAKHQTLVSHSNRRVGSSYYMELKAMNVHYNAIYIILFLVSFFIFNFNRQYSSPNCHSKSRRLGKHHRARPNIFFELFEWFGSAYCVHRNLEPVQSYLIWISKHRFDDHIGWPNLKYEMGPAGLYGHQNDVLRSK